MVKPAVSASSRGTMRVHPDAIDAGDAHLRAVVTNGDALVQPYFRSVEDYGERDFWVLRAGTHPEPPTNVQLQSGRWFLVSDDRHVHVDSRDFGQIDVSACLHIVYRVESRAGLGDEPKRLSIIW